MEQKTNLEKLKFDMETLNLGNLKTVEFDIHLPTSGGCGSTISWESEFEHILTREGKVSRPVYGMGNRNLTLTAFFTNGNETGIRKYQVTVLEEEKQICIVNVLPITMEVEVGKPCYLPEYGVAELKNGDVITRKIEWSVDREQQCKKEGIVLVEGQMEGYDKKVVLTIRIEKAVPFVQSYQDPQVSSLTDRKESNVVLLKGSACYEAQQRMLDYLLQVQDDHMLYHFRMAAGLDTQGAEPMIGWDAQDSQLRGHTTGHYLSALALCYRTCKSEKILHKATYMVQELKKCQEALEKQPNIAPGFLAAYHEQQFDQLEKYVKYPEIWAPYYTLHKILAGLLECYQWLDSKEALNLAVGMGDWVYHRLSKLSVIQREKMWSIYMSGEYGGLNESLARLYRYTKNENHIAASQMFDNERLFLPLQMGVDALSGMHVNQHIPQIIGGMHIFINTGQKKYYEIAKRFWKIVTEGHTYANGGVGESEMFHEKNNGGNLLTDRTTESCATYNMLKLTELLYQYSKDVRYMDYYEWALYNHTLPSLDKNTTGESTYFFPLEPGGQRTFDPENSCCHGTGMESHFKYTQPIFYSGENKLYVNLFVNAQMEWKEKNIKITQYVAKEDPGQVLLEIEKQDMNIESTSMPSIYCRIPGWCEQQYEVEINGKSKKTMHTSQGYLVFDSKEFQEAVTKVEIKYHCKLKQRYPANAPNKSVFTYGPYLLAAKDNRKEYLNVKEEEICEGTVLTKTEGVLQFQSKNLEWVPLYQLDKEGYHVYLSTAETGCEKG